MGRTHLLRFCAGNENPGCVLSDGSWFGPGIRVLLAASLCLLAGCAKPQPPYTGLDKQSYGALTNYQDSQTHQSVTPPLCDPQAKYQDVEQLSHWILGQLFKPVGGMTKIDNGILKEDLQDQFKVPGDIMMPTVVIIERDFHHIVFWYVADLVTLPEAADAARKILWE